MRLGFRARSGAFFSRLGRVLAVCALVARATTGAATLREAASLGPPMVEFTAGLASPQLITIGLPHHPRPTHHDAATCPQCITQSLHALAIARPALPVAFGSERLLMEGVAGPPALASPGTSHLSRAPPQLL